MRVLAIIPARYHSTRLPAKMLALIGTKPLIQHTYEQACKALPEVIVATDHPDIYQAVKAFGGRVCMTGTDHISGTDRCAEVLTRLQIEEPTKRYEVILNIQGDEPFIHPAQIQELIAVFEQKDAQIATLVQRIRMEEQLFSPNVVKAVLSDALPLSKALYFSRQPLPYMRGLAQKDWLENGIFYKHIGLYGFRSDILLELTRLRPSTLEQAESLEQLRWLQNGYAIHVARTEYTSLGIDTLEDLEKARAFI